MAYQRERITLAEFQARLRDQDVGDRLDFAFVCPVCATVQSMRTLIGAGVSPAKAESYVGFSCVGRFTGAGPHHPRAPAGRGCDWTLGGLLQLQELEIEADGRFNPYFRLATPEEAAALRAQSIGERAA